MMRPTPPTFGNVPAVTPNDGQPGRRRAFRIAFGSLLLALVVFAASLTARAQSAPAGTQSQTDESPSNVAGGADGRAGQAPTPSSVVAPVIVADPGVRYPEESIEQGLRAEVEVVLVVDVAVDGTVSKARVEAVAGTPDGAAGPFESAALEAVKRMTLKPAEREGRPIPARIKHRYRFALPPGRLGGRLFDATTGAPLGGARIEATPPSDGAGSATPTAVVSAPDGSFRIDDLPFGRYRVRILVQGASVSESDEEVDPGKETVLTLRVAPPSSVTESPQGAPVADEPVEEVTVRGKRPPREVTKISISQAEIRAIPGTGGDALRSITTLPGVARPPGLLGLLIVRGAAPNATNVFVDGTLVPIVFHFGGLSSVVPTDLLERLDFYPGNYSSLFGRGYGGVVDVGIRDPKKDGRFHGLAQVDLVDGRLLVEGPIAAGWRFAAAGRRSWVDVSLAPALRASGATVTAAPVYYDYQFQVQKDFSSRTSARVLAFGSDDRFNLLLPQGGSADPGVGGALDLGTAFWRVQGRFRHKVSSTGEFTILPAIGQDNIRFAVGANTLQIRTVPLTVRAEWTERVASWAKATVGLDFLYTWYDVFARLPPPNPPGRPPPGPGFSLPPLETTDTGQLYRPGTYLEMEVAPLPGTRILPGVRVDYTRETKSWDVAPRLVARQDIRSAFPRTTFKGGAGLFFQPTQPGDTNAVLGRPDTARNARALQYSFGAEQEITRSLEASLEGFYRKVDRTFTAGVGSVGEQLAYGLEVLLRYRSDSRFFGWLAYTLSRSTVQDTPFTPERTFQFDQTHILSVLGSYKLGRGWELGARYRLVSGNLTTPQAYGFYDQAIGSYQATQAFPPFGERLPLFHQLDVRIDKQWRFNGWTLDVYLDVINAYNQGNVEAYSYNYNATRRTPTTGLPFLPSIGVRGEL
jgi:TonB family protein